MMPGGHDGWQHEVDRRMALAREWDDLVDQVRQLPGFEDFLRPPPVDTLLPAAKDGPVVVVNVSQWRCDALVVRTNGVEAFELPELTQPEAVRRTNDYLGAVQAFQRATAARVEAERAWEAGAVDEAAEILLEEADTRFARARAGLEDTLVDTARWMWDAFAAKILEHLGYRSTPEDGRWPRVWWCPTGALTLLPLHAAGYHDGGADAVLDRVVSSYTPTLRALLQARADDRVATAAGERMLFVGRTNTPGQVTLPNVKEERRLLAELFPGDRSTILPEAESTRDNVLDLLAQHRWVHFSCHGEQDLNDPSHGGLYLEGGERLTVADVSTRQYRGDFAFLGACKTATGGVDLPDEAITLAAALHFTGYRHVIATLWSIVDRHAYAVTESVYGALVSDGVLDTGGAARALHDAVRALRDDPANRRRLSVWTPFAHIGP